MTEINPYKAYADESILNNTPIGLVVALYEGAIDASVNARRCLAGNDIPGRTKSINKIIGILTELMMRLDDEKGGEISQNLRNLYIYIQGRVLDAHIRKAAAPLEEIEKLFSTVLDGWKGAKELENSNPLLTMKTGTSSTDTRQSTEELVIPYGGYFHESGDFSAASAYGY